MTIDVELPIDARIDAILWAGVSLDFDSAESEARAMLDELSAEDRRRTVFGMLRAASALHAEISELTEYLARVQAEVQQSTMPKKQRLVWLEEQIKRTAEPLLTGKTKNVDMPGAGRVQYRDYSEALRVADAEAFIAALDADERERLVELRPHLKTLDAKQYAATVLAEHGEVMPGVERVEAHRTATISYTQEL